MKLDEIDRYVAERAPRNLDLIPPDEMGGGMGRTTKVRPL